MTAHRAVEDAGVETQQRDGSWRRDRLAGARVYLCADRFGHVSQDLAAFLEAAVPAGVDIVQLRDKTATRAEALRAAGVYREIALRHGALFVINDDPELAVAAEADGVHVGQDDMPPEEARRIVGPDRLVGRSTHAVTEIDRALAEDSDYLGVGPVHATPTKEGRPAVGLAPVRHAARTADRPFFVTGGMNADTAPAVIDAGGHGIVVVRALTEAADPAARARELAALFGRSSEAGGRR